MQGLTSFIGLKKGLKILFVASEEAPFVKVGGLGEVMFSLPRALSRLGHDARVIMPLYGTVDQEKYRLSYVKKGVAVRTSSASAGEPVICNVRKYSSSGRGRSPVTTYFIENREYFELRSNVYGYKDDRIRFLLLCRACLEYFAADPDWRPDVIVSADWMAGYLPNILRTEYRDHPYLGRVATVFSIHNLSSQGLDKPERYMAEEDRDAGEGLLPDMMSERLNFINSMRRGIMHSDAVNTVSENYAREITTEEYGAGLETLLAEKRHKLRGILNGIDYETNNPGNDRLLASRYDARNPDARRANKIALQKKLGLPPKLDAFLVGIVSRITRQKGFDLLKPVIEPYLRITGSQLAVVGTGDTELMDFFHQLQKDFPGQVVAYMQYDDDLPHMIFAGSDALLIPSKFEPSGLTQMEAMRYGAVPIARCTGGLADTIEDYRPGEGRGTGFLFDRSDPLELLIAMTRAYSGWRHRAEWRALERRVMSKDFSWESSAQKYVRLFEFALAESRGREEENLPPRPGKTRTARVQAPR